MQRRGGRRKGLPTTGGRARGTWNKTMTELLAAIGKRGTPIAFLEACAGGKRIRVADPEDMRRSCLAYPDAPLHVKASIVLFDKLIPSLCALGVAADLGGDNPPPLRCRRKIVSHGSNSRAGLPTHSSSARRKRPGRSTERWTEMGYPSGGSLATSTRSIEVARDGSFALRGKCYTVVLALIGGTGQSVAVARYPTRSFPVKALATLRALGQRLPVASRSPAMAISGSTTISRCLLSRVPTLPMGRRPNENQRCGRSATDDDPRHCTEQYARINDVLSGMRTKSMKPRALAYLLGSMALTLSSRPADAQRIFNGGASSGSSTQPHLYIGPCDQVSCAEAYSVTRAMTEAYTGALFQLGRVSDGTTMDVPQFNHRANIWGYSNQTGVTTFCNLTYCYINKVYGQINGNDLTPPSSVIGAISALCTAAPSTSPYCAPPFFIDPPSGLPTIRTLTPSVLYNGGGAATGFIGEGHAVSVLFYGRNEGWSSCCGAFGPAHAFNAPDVTGEDFLPGLGYGNGHTYVNCTTSTSVCAPLDIEGYSQGSDYLPQVNAPFFNAWTYDGTGATNTLTEYVNSPVPTYTGTPVHGAVMNTGQTIRIGGGGDGTHVDGIFQEGLITNTVLSPANIASILSNVNAFYLSRTPSPCQSTGDFGYSSTPASGPAALSSTWAAYGLRRMSASQFGPIADLTDSEASPVTHTYGPAASGCGLEPAAAAFCAANAPCYVTKLYNQGTWTSQQTGNVHDTDLDLVQATTANAPTVTFNALNGLPVMTFSGSQYICGGTLGATSGGAFVSYFAMVAQRTGNTSANNVVVSFGNSGYGIGFGNTSGKSYASIGAGVVSGTQAEGSWHSLVYDVTGTPSPYAVTFYTDGASSATTTQTAYPGPNTQKICIGEEGGGSYPLIGNIAEVTFGATAVPGGLYATTQEPLIFSLEKAAWGSGI